MESPGVLDLLSLPGNFISTLVQTNSQRVDLKNFVTCNLLLVGKFASTLPKHNCWRNVSFKFTENYELEVTRRYQVVCLPWLDNEVILSEEDSFNLMLEKCSPMEIPFIENKCELKLSFESYNEPLNAAELKICVLENFVNIDSDIIDTLLIDYFKYPRFLHKNDVFRINVDQYLPELQFTASYNKLKKVYFKVCNINSFDDKNNLNEGFIVNQNTRVYQLTTQKSFTPPQTILVCEHPLNENNFELKNFLKPLLPFNLQTISDNLIDCFRPFLVHKLEEIRLKPFFIVHGPEGSGKSLLISTVAKRLGLQYWNVECFELIIGPSGFNEAKLKTIFLQLKKHTPCLLQMSNIEMLSKDREGKDDKRITSTLIRLLSETKSDLPLFVVGTTSCIGKLGHDLLQNVLEVIKIDALTVEERKSALMWFSHISELIAQKIADLTSGFNHSDFSHLISQILRVKSISIDDDNSEKIEDEIKFEDCIKIIDKMNAETASAIGSPEVPNVGWTDVGGHNEIKKEIIRSLETANLGTGLRRSGLLLWGPPGTGKTLLAKAVANECKSTFLSIKGPELLNMYVGQSEQNVRQVFERAREAAPCIIFFDELDSLAPNRGKGDSTGVMDRVVSQLLSEMDGLQKNENIFVLGATNRPDLIDPALLRPGRLDKMLYVGPCEGIEAKLSVLKALTRKFKMNNDINLQKIAQSLPPVSTGADIYSICYKAWHNAATRVIEHINNGGEFSDTVILTDYDFDAALGELSLSD